MNKLAGILIVLSFMIQPVAEAQPPDLGKPVPEINLPDVNGKKISIRSLKGKVVLLDFWAAWCPPCRAANKSYLRKAYAKFKDKGFEIYSVSVDSDKGKWKRAIAADKIKWLQVNDPGDWDAPIARKWRIEAIPATFLINKKGEVVAYDLEGPELERAIAELLK